MRRSGVKEQKSMAEIRRLARPSRALLDWPLAVSQLGVAPLSSSALVVVDVPASCSCSLLLLLIVVVDCCLLLQHHYHHHPCYLLWLFACCLIQLPLRVCVASGLA
jgi:hypothetical protein